MACLDDEKGPTQHKEPRESNGDDPTPRPSSDTAPRPSSDIASRPSSDIASRPSSGEPPQQLTRRAWAMKIATVMAGVCSAVAATSRNRTLHDSAMRWVSVVSISFQDIPVALLVLRPWRVAFPPASPEARGRGMLILVVATALAASSSYLREALPDVAVLRQVNRLVVFVGIVMVAGPLWYRKSYGGFRNFVNNPLGVLVLLYWLCAVLDALTPASKQFIQIGKIMEVLLIFPILMVLHPYVACSRRRCGEETTREKISLDPAYLLLLSFDWFATAIPASQVLQLFITTFENNMLIAGLMWDLFMLLIVMYFKPLAQGAVTDKNATPWIFMVLFIQDAFSNLIFFNTSIDRPDFWALLGLQFVMLVVRNADLWSDLLRFRCRGGALAFKAADATVRMSEEQASLCSISEFTATLSAVLSIGCELVFDEADVGEASFTYGMPRGDKLKSLAVMGVLFAMQIIASLVSHSILAYKRRMWAKSGGKDGTSSMESAASNRASDMSSASSASSARSFDQQASVVVNNMWVEHGIFIAAAASSLCFLLMRDAASLRADQTGRADVYGMEG